MGSARQHRRMAEQSFLYFAYGSNLLTRRLRAANRAPSAQPLGVGRLSHHRLTFDKLSDRDGSGKCDAERTDRLTDCVVGVVYRIECAEQAALDLVEGVGLGYRRVEVEVETDGGTLTCRTYLATLKRAGIKPFDWYKALVLAGAREHGLPNAYIEAIERVDVESDPDPLRRALHAPLLGPG
jgi:gamma-glutamylcyclotransferase